MIQKKLYHSLLKHLSDAQSLMIEGVKYGHLFETTLKQMKATQMFQLLIKIRTVTGYWTTTSGRPTTAVNGNSRNKIFKKLHFFALLGIINEHIFTFREFLNCKALDLILKKIFNFSFASNNGICSLYTTKRPLHLNVSFKGYSHICYFPPSYNPCCSARNSSTWIALSQLSHWHPVYWFKLYLTQSLEEYPALTTPWTT